MLRHAVHLRMIHEIHESESLHWLAPNPDVLGDRHVRHQVEFLMDHRDPRIEGSEWRRQLHRFAMQSNLSCVWLINAGDDLHQGRFAGAIFAHQRVDSPRANSELDVIECHDAGEGLAHSFHLQEIRRFREYSGDLGFVEGLVKAQGL